MFLILSFDMLNLFVLCMIFVSKLSSLPSLVDESFLQIWNLKVCCFTGCTCSICDESQHVNGKRHHQYFSRDHCYGGDLLSTTAVCQISLTHMLTSEQPPPLLHPTTTFTIGAQWRWCLKPSSIEVFVCVFICNFDFWYYDICVFVWAWATPIKCMHLYFLLLHQEGIDLCLHR